MVGSLRQSKDYHKLRNFQENNGGQIFQELERVDTTVQIPDTTPKKRLTKEKAKH
jgi:hypothetical protein